MDERTRIHEQHMPAFPTHAWYELRRYLTTIRANIVQKIEFNDALPTARKTLWDRIVIWVAEWAIRPRIKKEDQVHSTYEA